MEKDLKTEKYFDVILEALKFYNEIACPCAFPRFRQITGIDCVDTGDSYMSIETEVLIANAKQYFEIKPISHQPNDEDWICKKCSSIFHYNWSDFSIAVSRSTLKPIKLKVKDRGKPAHKPIPLYKGLQGHSYPAKDQIIPVTLEEFSNYILEKTEI